jgi:microcystin-dependent protein
MPDGSQKSPSQHMLSGGSLSGAAPTTLAPTSVNTPGPGAMPSPWVQDGPQINYDEGGATLPKNVPGGNKGDGTLNAKALYVNGIPVTVAGGENVVLSQGPGIVLTPSPILNAGSIGLAPSGVVAASYGGALAIPVIAVDAFGRITSASTVAGGWITQATAVSMFVDVGGDTMTGPLTTTRLGVGMAPSLTATSKIWSDGDITLSGGNHMFSGNLYYEGGWKYTAGGATAASMKMGIDTSLAFQLAVAPNNTGAAGAVAVPVPAINVIGTGSVDLPGPVHSGGPAAGRWQITGNTFQLFGSGGANSVILQHDNTHAYLRPQNAASNLYLGAAGANHVVISAVGHFQPVLDNVSTLGQTTARWANIYATRLYAYGAGQTAANYDPAGVQGSSIWLHDTGSAVGTGGAVVFADSFGAFAALKGYALSGTGPLGDVILSMRKLGSDTTFTEHTRFGYLGGITLAGTLRSNATVAIPAGGTLGSGVMLSSTANFGIMYGTGLPDKAAPQGTWYMRKDASDANPPFYFNKDGTAAGWSASGGGGAAVSVGTTPPGSPTANQLWWNTDAVTGGGTMYIYYNDGSTSQWVPAAPAASGQTIPPGSITDFAGDTAPSGWLLCQGQSVTVAAYPALHAAIAYKYGGSGANFNVPDLGGRVTAGKEAVATRLTVAGAGIDGSVVGAVGGAQTHALLDTQNAAHAHGIADTTHGHSVMAGYSSLLANAGTLFCRDGTGGAFIGYSSFSADAAYSNQAGSNNSGSGLAHQNTQPTIIMNKIIKT